MNLNDLPSSPLAIPAAVRPVASAPDLLVRVGHIEADVREAQALRHQVFGLEMGASGLGPQAAHGLDAWMCV